jgi:hypothetical protein
LGCRGLAGARSGGQTTWTNERGPATTAKAVDDFRRWGRIFPPAGQSCPRPPMRNSTRHSYLAVLAAPLLLVGCGASVPAGALLSGTTQSAAEATLKRVKAPPGFRVGKCEFLQTGSNTRCYRHGSFVAIDAASFSALITASGLKADRSPPMWCNSGRHRPSAAIARDNCLAHANLGSVAFAVSATSVKVLRRSSLRPRALKVVRSMRGTIYEVTSVTTDGSS